MISAGKLFGHAKSPSPASSNYDFTLRHERVKLFAKVLKQFDTNVARTVQTMHEVASTLFLVGESYHEVAQYVNNTNPQSAVNSAYAVSRLYSNQVVENYGADLQGAASMFAREMKNLHEGEQYVTYREGVRQMVLTRLHEVMAQAKKTSQLGDSVAAALRKAVAARKTVQKKQAKYVKLNKPLTESKRYAKQSEEMRQREKNYETKLRTFDAAYEDLMQRQLYVTGHTMDEFIDTNTAYLAQILKVLSCLAPHGADAVENMVAATQDRGNQLGIPSEDQVAGRLETRDVNRTPDLTHKRAITSKGSLTVTPVRGTPGRSALGSSHNFTSYYRNRKHRSASAELAPPTARALDEDDGNAGGRGLNHLCGSPDGAGTDVCVAPSTFWSTPGTPRGRHAALSEPDPTPPSNPPSCANPLTRLGVATGCIIAAPAGAAGSGAAMPVVPRTGGVVITKGSKGAAVAPAAAPPVATAKPRMLARAAASSRQRQQPSGAVSVKERSVTQSPGRAPFGEGTTPAFKQPSPQRPSSPPAVISPVVLTEAGSHSDTVAATASQHRRTAALQSQAVLLGLDRARSTEPYDDDCPKGVASYTSRPSLEPVNLLPAMEAAADRPSEVPRQCHVNPLAVNNSSGRGDGGAAPHQHDDYEQPSQQQQQQHVKSRHTTRRSGTVPSAGFAPQQLIYAGAAAASMVATAPPPDEATLSSSTNSHFPSESNATSFQESLSFSYGQNRTCLNNNNMSHPPSQSISAGVKSYSNGEGWESETGGVTGRSNALSASYALDSPAYAPHLRGMEMQTWVDHNVRACSPA